MGNIDSRSYSGGEIWEVYNLEIGMRGKYEKYRF